MDKLVMFRDMDDEEILFVLHVKNYNEDFENTIDKLREEWSETSDESLDCFIINELKKETTYDCVNCTEFKIINV